MPKDLSADQVAKLFLMRSVQDVEVFLDLLNKSSPNEWDWRPLGGRLNNAGNVELITEPGPPIMVPFAFSVKNILGGKNE